MNETDQEIAVKEAEANHLEGERTLEERLKLKLKRHKHSILSESTKRPKKQLSLTIPQDTLIEFRKQYPKVCISCYLESHILMDLRK